ncbi:MAG TPA: hypothetical protein VN612_12610 [Acidobacteriaceae bacterium]|nr:hypothetical protein [Acidobacteriaceae bacterium]
MIAVLRKMHIASDARLLREQNRYSCNMLTAMKAVPRRRVSLALLLFVMAVAFAARAQPLQQHSRSLPYASAIKALHLHQ